MSTANTVFSTTFCYDCGDSLVERDGEHLHTSYTACPGFLPSESEYADGRESDEYRADSRAFHNQAAALSSDSGERSKAEGLRAHGEIVSYTSLDYCTRNTRKGQCNTVLGSSGRCYNAQYHLFDQS